MLSINLDDKKKDILIEMNSLDGVVFKACFEIYGIVVSFNAIWGDDKYIVSRRVESYTFAWQTEREWLKIGEAGIYSEIIDIIERNIFENIDSPLERLMVRNVRNNA
jgi:hypothetical protein